MTFSQRKPPQSGAPLVYSTGPAIRFCLMLVVTLVLIGSGLQQAIAQPFQTGSTPAEFNAISASKAIEPTRPVYAESPAATDIDDNFIFFPPGSGMVDDIGKEKLRKHAERLKKSPKKFVTLIGTTDGQGSSSYNLAIAEERLMAVSYLLRPFGLAPKQIRRNRAGSVNNPNRCAPTDCRQQTHTVELVYSP